MVLRAWLLVFVIAAAGCIPKTAPVTLETAQPITVAFVYDAEGNTPPGAVSDGVRDAVLDALRARNLKPVEVDGLAEFARRKASGQRLQWLADQNSGYVLLVEARASYYNQINGMYRWNTSFKATMSAGDGYPVDANVEVPVFLRFSHEKAVEAQEAAKDVVGKRVGRLADTVIGGGSSASLGVQGAERTARAGPTSVPATQPMGAGTGDGLGPIYFVMVDRFRNGDPSNDGDVDPADPQARHGGDLRGVIEGLDHLQSLGVKTVWLSPVFDARTETIGEWGGYHGYWVTGEPTVEPAFGTVEDLRELSDELHRRGMKLLLDVVTNHVGYDVPLVAERPDWFHDNGDVVDWSDPVQAVEHDVHGLPDLAQENPEVEAFLIEQARFWIDAVEPDGFRLDAVRHVGLPFWQRYTDAVTAHAGPEFVLLGELFDGAPAAVDRVWRAGGFSHMFDFPLHYALLDVLCDGAHPGRLASVLAEDARYPRPGGLVTFADNHDLPRVASRCADVWRPLGLMGQLRGEPSWTWGTEQGMDGAEEPANRASFDWSEGPRAGAALRLASIGGARADYGALRSAPTRVLAVDADGLAVARATPTDAQIVVVSVGEQPWAYTAPGAEPLVSPAHSYVVESLSGDPAAALFRSLERVARTSLEVSFGVAGAPAGELRAVGAGRSLGDWDPASGVAIGGGEPSRFVGGSLLEYKLVVVGADGSVTWEPRETNRYLFVGEGPTRAELTWGS